MSFSTDRLQLTESLASMSVPARPPRVQLVVKLSKYCNLRCTYCYEFNELSNKSRISIANIARMFSQVRHAVDARVISGVEFVWHGGEPLLIPVDYYREIAVLQDETFDDPDTFQNVTQTNLTVLTGKHIEFLKSKEFFQGIGVSFDLFGDQRVDVKGRLRNSVVMMNMERLIEHGIEFGAISVLTRKSLGHARQIQKFWEALGIGFRFLPFHLSVGEEQSRIHGLTGPEQALALKQCFLDWLASGSLVSIRPMNDYLTYALCYMAGGEKAVYDPALDEAVYVVNVDGNIFGVGQGELYEARHSYGNIFTTSLVDILSSPNRRKGSSEAAARMDLHCRQCPYFGYCPGHPVADAAPEELQILDTYGCVVRDVLDFMVGTLLKADFANDIMARLKNGKSSAATAVAMSVGI